MEKNSNVFNVLMAIAGLAVGAALWLIPYWGFLATGYANLLPVLGLSILGIFVVMFSFTLALDAFSDTPFGPGLFFGTIISIVIWFALLFTNNVVSVSSSVVWQKDHTPQVESPAQARIYPFWYNDFTEVFNTRESINYEMDQRCGDNICTVRATVHYAVQHDFVARNADGIHNYAPLVRQALTQAIVRDEAYGNLEDLQTAVCSNFKANVGMADDAACPLNMRVSLNVTQN